MSCQRLGDYLSHMGEASGLALSYVEGMDARAFLADRRTQQAVIFNLMVIGEAASKISKEYPEFVAQHPEVPWKGMTGMRNRLAHGYFAIDLEVVWSTVKEALRPLSDRLDSLRTEVGGDAS